MQIIIRKEAKTNNNPIINKKNNYWKRTKSFVQICF